MQTTADAATVDLTRTRVTLQKSVVFTPQICGDDTYYHVETAGKQTYYRIGFTEYVFLSLLDGNTSFSEALAVTARTLNADALPQQRAFELYKWAIEHRIVVLAESETSGNKSASGPQPSIWQKLNPLWIRIPFGRPDALLDWISPLLGWLFAPAATVIAIGFMMLAIARIIVDMDRFSNASENVFAPDNWIWLLAAWILLKIVHEAAHGIVCRRYGGEVRETGIILALFAPLAYVDVTSCWSFRSRWSRIHTALAGIYIELLIAAVAVFVWAETESTVIAHLAYNVIVMASFSTIVFNANPLMRFDGYYVLSDFLRIPNLYSSASQAVRQFLARILLGRGRTDPSVAGHQYLILLIYGTAAFFWRLFICAAMIITASVFLHGAGIVLSAVAVLAWFASPLIKGLQGVARTLQIRPSTAARAMILGGGFAALTFAALFRAPVPFRNKAPGIICLPDGAIVRSGVDAFVAEVYVQDGQFVESGQLLASLRNEETVLRQEDLRLQIRQETLRLQEALKQHDAAQARIAEGNLESLREQLAEADAQVEALNVRAPHRGQVIARQLHERIGTYVEEGKELLIVDDGTTRELRISVAQEDFAAVEALVGSTVRTRIGSRPVCSGTVSRVIPRASRQPGHQQLAASEGGPLPVTFEEDASGNSVVRLTEQRFAAIVTLDEPHLFDSAGERGHLSLPSVHSSIAMSLYYGIRSWIAEQFKNAAAENRA